MVGWTVPLILVLLPLFVVGGTAYVANWGIRSFRPEGSNGAAWFPTLDENRRPRRTHIVPQALDNEKFGRVAYAPLLSEKGV